MRRFLLLSFLMAFSVLVFAQTRTITGTVTDESGNPIPNASVLIKGTTIGTTTSNAGYFSISVPGNRNTLVVSAVGLGEGEVILGSANNVQVKLSATNTSLDEVLVVGYGRRSVRENTGAISKVGGDQIAATPLPSFDQALAGKSAGVQTTASGGLLGDGVAIRIRGVNSISTSSQPLYVIDGVPQVAATNLNGFNSGDGTRFNPMALINPNDIESIEILKDAGASAIYGSRAANGVVLITTKKGKVGTAKVTLDVKRGWSNATNLPRMLNAEQFTTITNEKASNKYGVGTANAVVAKPSDINKDGVNDETDWMSLLYRTGKLNDYGLSASGGTEKMQFFGSARYLDQEGISINNRFRSGQIRLSGDVTPNKWFKTGFGVSYSKTLNNGILSNFYTAGSTIGWQAIPNVSPYNPDGPQGYNLRTVAPIGVMDWGNNVRSAVTANFSFYNPLNSYWNRNENTAEDLRSNFYAEVQPVSGLKLTTKFGIQAIRNFEDQYTPPYQAGLGNPYNGLVQNQTQNNSLWDWQNILSYDKLLFGDHRVGITLGSEYQKNNYSFQYVGAANFSDPFFTHIIEGAYTNVQPGTTGIMDLTGGNLSSSGIESYFGRVNYTYRGKYMLEGSLRRDSYSGFGANNRWGTFPAISLGWEISKEAFMANQDVVDYLKLRGSFGKTGNSNGVGAYSSRVLYGGAAYTSLTGLGNTQAGNAGLRWESSDKLDIGVEANFLNSRLGVVVDYFKTDINNLILNAPVLYSVGVPNSSIIKNIGGMYNKGIEVTINATPVIAGDFSWRTSFNYTNIQNRVTGLVPENDNADIVSANQVASVGKPLSTFYISRWAGVDPQTGNPQWYAKDGTIKRYNFGATGVNLWTDDKGTPVAALSGSDNVYLDGKAGLPKWYGGWDNNFSYKNIFLQMSLFYQGGNYIYNGTRAIMLSNSFLNNSTEILNRWQKPGDNTDVARLYLIDNAANAASDRFLEKGDFLRMRTVTLGYDLPKSIMNKIGFDGIRVYGTVLNAFTITGYSGADPEVNTNRFSNIAIGVDTRSVPQSRTLLFGIQANF